MLLYLEGGKYYWILKQFLCRLYVKISSINHIQIDKGYNTTVIGKKKYDTFSNSSICW